MQRSYYQKYYSFERNHWWFIVRAGILKKVINRCTGIKAGARILNAGVATGRTTEDLSIFGSVTSVENDPECCRFLREELNMEVTEASVTDLPFEDGIFDMICVLDVLEHVDDDRSALKELHRLNSKDGWLVLTVPAYQWLWSRHDEVNHHCRRYTRSQIRQRLEQSGYRIQYLSYFNSFLFPFIAVYRLVSRPFVKGTPLKSDFEIAGFEYKSWTNKLFGGIFGIEKKLIPSIRFPFGVSVIAVASKN
ncbi:MAG: methyltransferase domain-containing protein [Chitinophagaceae bacterium]